MGDGPEEVHLAAYHHGKGQVGTLVEAHAGDCLVHMQRLFIQTSTRHITQTLTQLIGNILCTSKRREKCISHRRGRYWPLGGCRRYNPYYGHSPVPPTFLVLPIAPEQELQYLDGYREELEVEKKDLEEELKGVETRINELKKSLQHNSQEQ